MLAQRWPDVVQPTKYNFGCAIFMLAQRWPYIVSQHNFQISSSRFWRWVHNVGPTLCTQRQLSANGTTVFQRWPNVVMISGQEGLRRVFPYARWLDIYGRFMISAVLLISKTGENHTLMLHLCL